MRRAIMRWSALIGLALGFASPLAQAHPNQGCNYCHVPHGGAADNTQVPLWEPTRTTTHLTNHYQGGVTMNATLAAPDGASKLCLSCHDGSYPAVSGSHSFAGYNPYKAGMGPLTNTHPVSFLYDSALAQADKHLEDPSHWDLPNDMLDAQGKMQCTSCHQVHNHPGRQVEGNLRWTYTGEEDGTSTAFCRHCHKK